jgi:hypothetical protein
VRDTWHCSSHPDKSDDSKIASYSKRPYAIIHSAFVAVISCLLSLTAFISNHRISFTGFECTSVNL